MNNDPAIFSMDEETGKLTGMLTEWENKNGIHTEHVNVNNDNDVEKKLANHEIDAFVFYS